MTTDFRRNASAEGAARGVARETLMNGGQADYPANAPAWMTGKKIWLNWKLVKKKGKSKPDKVPFYADGTSRSGKLGTPKDREKLVTHAIARTCGNALGFALLDEERMVGIDLDDCLDEKGELTRHKDMVEAAVALGAYIEVTPSGRGLHIVGIVSPGFGPVSMNAAVRDGIEVYTHARFFTFTGRRFGAAPDRAEPLPLDELIEMAMERRSGGERRQSNAPPLPETPANIERVRDALAVLSEAHGYSAYSAWWGVLAALRWLGWDCGREIALWWSQEIAGGWHGEAGFSGAWNGRERGSGVVRTVYSLFYEARQLGWVDPLRPTFMRAEGELGLARVFAERHAGRMLYSHGDDQWHGFKGGVWRQCQCGEPLDEAESVLDDLRGDAARVIAEGATAEAVQYMKWAVSMQTRRVASAIVALATVDRRLAVAGPQVFDRDPDLLNVRNGVVDLRTGQLLPHDPGHLMRKQAGAAFIKDAKCPRWLTFIDEVTCGDAEYAAYLQRMFGLTLTGHVCDEVMFFEFGSGANGKSVLCNVHQHVLGDYVAVMPAACLMVPDRKSGGEGATPALTKLAGARLALVNETESTDRLSSQQVKQAVSIDSITARGLYSDFFTFAPTHKVVLRGNHRPIVVDMDYGLWRRIHLLPFLRTFTGDAADPRLCDELKAETDGILAWAVAGAQEWYRAGHRLRDCKQVRKATAEYRTASDILGEWLDEGCELIDDAETEVQKTYAEYAKWCQVRGLRALTLSSLSRQLEARGILSKRKGGGNKKPRFYIGLKVLF